MPKQRVDLLIKIAYDLNHPENSVIRTNMKTARLQDVLGDYLHGRIGQGKDKRKPNRKKNYNITIRLDLSDDTFSTSSDTGNTGLTCGLIMHVYQILNKLKILPL